GAGREIRAREGAVRELRDPLLGLLDRGALRRVGGRMEDDHVRRAHADAEGLQRLLGGLVAMLARDGEALVPALRDLSGGESAEDGEDEPDRDDWLPATRDEVTEASKQA